MDFNFVLELFFAVTALWMFLALRHLKPSDTYTSPDLKRHGKQLRKITFTNKIITFLTLFVPILVIMACETVFPQPRGWHHIPNFVWRFCLTGVLCQIIKLIVSSPRPNAIQLEDSNVNKIYDNSNFESRQSFFSGHSAAAICSFLFMKSYLTYKLEYFYVANHATGLLLKIIPILGLYPGWTQFRAHWVSVLGIK